MSLGMFAEGSQGCSRSAPNGWVWPLVVDLDVAQQPPRADLDLGTLAGFHVDALIPEERGSAGGHPGARGNVQLDISDQVEDAKDGCLTRRPGAQVQPHVTNEDHDLLISPSDGQGAFSHIPQEREHRLSGRRTPGGAGASDPEPGGHRSQNDCSKSHP